MARIDLTSGRTNTPGAITGTTANVVVPPDRLVLVFVSNAATATLLAVEPAISGLGIAWSKVVSNVTMAASSDRRLTCFRGITGSTGATGPITFNFPGQNQDIVAWSVFAYDGIDLANGGANAVGQSASAPASGTSISVPLGPFVNANNPTIGAVMLSAPIP